MSIILEARNMTKVFNNIKALDGVDFIVHQGECFGFLGSTGSGKSTLIQILSGATYLSSGDYFINGLNGRKNRAQIQTLIGVLPDHEILDPQLSVIINLRTYAKYFGRSTQQATKTARDLLRFARLEDFEGVPIEDLSLVMRRRLELCMALVNDPKVLLLDEPTRGLDRESAQWVWSALEKLKINGMTLLLASSQIQEVERLCDRICLIEKGKVLIEGEPDKMISDLVGNNVVEFKVDPADLDYHIKKIKERYRYQVLDNRVRLFLRNPSEANQVLSLVVSDTIQVRRASLDDVFIQVAGYDLHPRVQERT